MSTEKPQDEMPSDPIPRGDSTTPEESTKETGKKKGKLGTSRGVETLFRTSYRVHMDLSSLADAKANIMISINGIIISIIIASISPKIDSNTFLLIPTSVLLLSCLISIVYAVLAARPRVSSNVVTLEDFRSQHSNILFFGNYVSMPEEDFVEGMTDLMQDQTMLYQSMIKDIYGLGKVLSKKFILLRKSYMAFMIGLILGILLFIASYIYIVFLFDDPDGVVALRDAAGLFV